MDIRLNTKYNCNYSIEPNETFKRPKPNQTNTIVYGNQLNDLNE